MYEREISTPTPDKPYAYSSTPPTVNIQPLPDPSEATYPFVPNPDEDTSIPTYIVFVHGYNMTLLGSTNYAETMFKRLWWRGYKGRFASFRWNTYGNGTAPGFSLAGLTVNLFPGGAVGTYNDSEFVAWHSGAALKTYVGQLQSLPGNYTVDIVSHSMGSIVVGEAIEEGMSVENYAILHGAASASCYNTPSFTFPTTNSLKPSPDGNSDSTTSSLASSLAFKDIGTCLPVNFFDDQDSVVGSIWELNNQGFKPQAINTANPTVGDYYYYTPSDPAGQKLGFEADIMLGGIPVVSRHRALTDFAEARAYADYSLTGTIGITDTTSMGSITSSINDSYFGDHHSNEFNWSIQQLTPFYNNLMISFFLIPNP